MENPTPQSIISENKPSDIFLADCLSEIINHPSLSNKEDLFLTYKVTELFCTAFGIKFPVAKMDFSEEVLVEETLPESIEAVASDEFVSYETPARVPNMIKIIILFEDKLSETGKLNLKKINDLIVLMNSKPTEKDKRNWKEIIKNNWHEVCSEFSNTDCPDLSIPKLLIEKTQWDKDQVLSLTALKRGNKDIYIGNTVINGKRPNEFNLQVVVQLLMANKYKDTYDLEKGKTHLLKSLRVNEEVESDLIPHLVKLFGNEFVEELIKKMQSFYSGKVDQKNASYVHSCEILGLAFVSTLFASGKDDEDISRDFLYSEFNLSLDSIRKSLEDGTLNQSLLFNKSFEKIIRYSSVFSQVERQDILHRVIGLCFMGNSNNSKNCLPSVSAVIHSVIASILNQ